MIGTLSGLMLSMLLAALDQTIVGTAEPRIIASLSGLTRAKARDYKLEITCRQACSRGL